ncbi:PhzF family phenazine biosynthesis protein [Ideonella sp.]|uniref:PhzF family phenazine biosynthesis protein n=1 Tax=Ideonella sp. TaxID=1929293 RepID=UPI002B481E38|nr:PhzF family phenazine biosynthesis protein [Ideonella sp.]HJV71799.1 PhzF family phenazine biosynthesis protein [Ideonella sp.]
MSTTRRFSQLDVFTATPLKGNPLAVVHDADGLSDAEMAAFARWTNLSETTFLLPPTDARADYRVRIFTPGGELPFAGHPTLGSCHAWLAAGGVPKQAGQIVQQCGVGLVTVRRDGTRLAFAAPPLKREPVDDGLLAQVVDALGLPPADLLAACWLDNGPKWLGLRVANASRVRALAPDHGRLKALAKVGLVAAQDVDGAAGTQFEVRGFAAPIGVEEDPVTGSLNASLAQWLIGEGVAPPAYTAAQGTAMGRAGRVHVQRDGDTVWVGGDVAPCISGQVLL